LRFEGGFVSDSNSFDRRHLLTAAAAGIVGAAAGFFTGRGMAGDKDKQAPPATAPDVQPATGPLAAYDWTLTVQGGYGWWFKKNGNKTNVSLLALEKAKCTCSTSSDCIDHPMLLITFANKVEIDGDTTYQPTVQDNMLVWVLEGPTRFIKGMPGNGIRELPGTKWDEIKDPYGPEHPEESIQWDDQVWLPERLRAKNNAASYASAELLLTDGKLTVCPPRNEKAKVGRWVFKEGNTTKRKALTDVLELSGEMQDVLGIETKAGKIFLKPKTSRMHLSIRHMTDPGTTTLTEGEPPPHYAQLFDFVDGQNCKDAVLPVFELRKDIKKKHDVDKDGFTPGDLCPPVILN
jgi:hypothetical protein